MDYGLVLDLETTGLDPKTDKIIEIGVLEFAVEAGTVPVITRTYSGIEDPGRRLDPEIAKITGLSNEILKDQQIDWTVVNSMVRRSSVLIAHNLDFDRPFLAQHPLFHAAYAHWACSLRHIDWRKHGFRTQALNYLAADHGFINPFAHRALFDCATTFRLISPHLDELMLRSFSREYEIRAVDSPFESKDELKKRGYRWNAEAKFWQRTVLENELLEERRFLAEHVYKGASTHKEIQITG